MEFISGLLVLAGSWLGFGSHQPEPMADPIVAEVGVMQPSEQDSLTNQMPNTDQMKPAVTSSTPARQSTMGDSVIPVDKNDTDMSSQPLQSNEAVQTNVETMLVAGGCFWCVEADIEKLPGVITAVSGYAGGTTDNPTYNSYKSGGHREVVEVTYDPTKVSFEEILIKTIKTTDPTDDDGTFADRGDGYSSALFYETDEQKTIIENLIADINTNGPYTDPLAVDVEPRPQFWPAEDYHQDYSQGNLLQQAQYRGYRAASGRNRFIEQHWGDDTSPTLPWRESTTANTNDTTVMKESEYPWVNYIKPDIKTLQLTMDATAFRVTQEDGTERAGTSPLDKIYDPGIYVDVLSGEPLFSSKDKFDSGTGWPSFVAPIAPNAVTEHEDRKLFVTRTEIRSAIADNHLGHVFNDGPADRGGLRYCMNGAALRFIPESEMVTAGYGHLLAAI